MTKLLQQGAQRWAEQPSGLAIAIVVYGINMFGNALRDMFDPRLRGGLGCYSSKTLHKRVTQREPAEK